MSEVRSTCLFQIFSYVMAAPSNISVFMQSVLKARIDCMNEGKQCYDRISQLEAIVKEQSKKVEAKQKELYNHQIAQDVNGPAIGHLEAVVAEEFSLLQQYKKQLSEQKAYFDIKVAEQLNLDKLYHHLQEGCDCHPPSFPL